MYLFRPECAFTQKYLRRACFSYTRRDNPSFGLEDCSAFIASNLALSLSTLFFHCCIQTKREPGRRTESKFAEVTLFAYLRHTNYPKLLPLLFRHPLCPCKLNSLSVKLVRPFVGRIIHNNTNTTTVNFLSGERAIRTLH